MIQTQELRLGNILLHEGIEKKVESIYLDGDITFGTIDGFNFPKLEDCEPVPITPERLVKLGFRESFDYFDTFILDSCIVEKAQKPDIYYFRLRGLNQKILYTKPIKYIHQLQNIYFALTDKEL